MIGKIDDASFRVTHEALIRFDQQPRPVAAPPPEPIRNPVACDAEPMPAGVVRWPPQRPDGYELRWVAPARIIHAIHALETKPGSGGHAAHAAPADRLFAVWFRVLDWLGTRTLTMGEMSSLLTAHVAGQSATAEDRVVKTLERVDTIDTGLKSFDELCKFAGELSVDGLAAQGQPLFAVLHAGETGTFVAVEDEALDETADKVVFADVVVLKEFVVADPPPPPVLTPGAIFWSSITPRLSQAPVDLIVGLIDCFSESDEFLDEQKRADALPPRPAPVPEPVPRPVRRARPAAVSVSRITADIQLAQTLHRYLKVDQPGARVDVRDPDAKIDLVEAYRLYRQLIDARELTSCQTVENWLIDWGVARAP
jgi:hypothetical protein